MNIIPGQVFKTQNCGPIEVTEYRNRSSIIVQFIDTGHTLKTTKDVLVGSDEPRLKDPLSRTVFDVGRIGIGRHKAHVNGSDTHAFSIWRAMLRRCYYKPEGRPWRDGKVCREWLCFQAFADWFEDNYPNDGEKYQLDKDIRFPGNKTYGPHYCQFVTQQENLASRKRAGRKPKEL